MPKKEYVISENEEGMRLDRWVRLNYPSLTQAHLQKMIRQKDILVNNQKQPTSYHLELTDKISIWVPTGEKQIKEKKSIQGEFLKDLVLYKDKDVCVINKPAGLAVQGGSKLSCSLDQMLESLRFGSSELPRLVHRLDKETSGVCVLARTRKAAQRLTKAFKERNIHKIYWAVCKGVPPSKKGTISLALSKKKIGGVEKMVPDKQGAPAETEYQVLEKTSGISLLEVRPLTGRTHQIRVHCAASGFPLLGDRKYGDKKDKNFLYLHAKSIQIPDEDGVLFQVEAPLPEAWKATLEKQGFKIEGKNGFTS